MSDKPNESNRVEQSKALDERKQTPIVLYVDVYPYRIDANSGEPLFLVLRRRTDVQLADSWQPASGKIRAGERISTAFARMVQAKTGQRASRLWALDQLNMFYDGYYDAVMIVPAAAAEIVNDPIVLQTEYHCESAWVSGEKARQLLIWPNQLACIVEIERALAAGPAGGRYEFRNLRVSE